MKKLFLMACNTYPTAPLSGCINDLRLVADFAITKRGFKKSEIRLLVNGRMKRAAALERLHWLAKAKKGDVIGLWQSGHGTQVATRSDKGEVDGLDEVFCMQDFDWSEDTMLRDKDYVQSFRRMRAGVICSIGSDSCHSGDLRRGFEQKNGCTVFQKTFPMPADIRWRNESAKEEGFAQAARIAADGGVACGFVSGCMSAQTSADAFISGQYYGAMTFYFVKALEAGDKKPLKEVVAKCCEYLAENGFDQTPQCEGPQADMPFLG